MEQSNIINKQTVEQAVEHLVHKVRSWTLNELVNILKNPNTNKKNLIIALGPNAYILGKDSIKINHTHCLVLDRNSEKEYYFVNKVAAFAYAICNNFRRYELAEELRNYDLLIDKHSIEVDRFKYRLVKARKNKNSHAIDLYSSRLKEAETRLHVNKFLLEKTLISAKYLNFRNH